MLWGTGAAAKRTLLVAGAVTAETLLVTGAETVATVLVTVAAVAATILVTGVVTLGVAAGVGPEVALDAGVSDVAALDLLVGLVTDLTRPVTSEVSVEGVLTLSAPALPEPSRNMKAIATTIPNATRKSAKRRGPPCKALLVSLRLCRHRPPPADCSGIEDGASCRPDVRCITSTGAGKTVTFGIGYP